MAMEMYNENDNEVLSIYLKEINKFPVLSHEEEYELALKAKSGDKRARERLINSNLRFVVSVAKKFKGQGLPLSDLINEGNIGLLTALDKFEPDMGYHFISYAVWWIRQSIMKAISDKGRAVRLPLNRSNELLQIQKAVNELMAKHGSVEPKASDIAKLTGLDEATVINLLQLSADPVSFDSPVKKEDGDSTFGEFIEDEGKGPEEMLVESSMKRDVASLLEVLNDKERDIISKRFGFDGNDPKSLKEIGDEYNLTKERIRQIEKRALEKLKEASLEREMDSYRKVI